jgi:hypothetical protein
MNSNSFRLLLAVSAAAFAGMLFAQAPAARTEIANAAQPQLAVGSDGRVWLVYAQAGEPAVAPAAHVDHAAHADGQKQKGHSPQDRSGDVFVAWSKDGGATFAPAVKVAHLPKLMFGMRRGPRIAVHGDRLTVTMIGTELVAFSSSDGGKTWSDPVTINEMPTSAREGLHDLAGAADGRLFVTWLDNRNGRTELWGASSMDGGRTWGKNEQVYRSPDKSICECCHPTALFDAEGNLAVMWRNSIEGSRDMWLTTRSKGAVQFTAARKLGEGTWKLNACPMDGGRIIALGGGKFGAVWQRAGEIFICRGEGPEMNLGPGKQPVAVHPGDRPPLVVWQQGSDLVAWRGLHGSEPVKLAADARFPSLVALPGAQGAVLAFERGAAKGPTSVAIERL